MKRVKRHKVKSEKPETSTSHTRDPETQDLAYYIHDRVELMHQVFSVLKYKELKAIAPACIRNISQDDLQELCTEELLGISSKRLCAILDGADPPSDTESSSPSPPPENLETISLDSISSDEEILSQASSKKKKHKHRRRDSKSKSKRKRSADEDDTQQNKASRAGLTVLELLELQARARAIRAQLQQEQIHKTASETVVADPRQSSESEVEIKEEPAEVVEISSEDEKPLVQELQRQLSQEAQSSQPVVKRVSDMVVIAPQKPTQKIKLNRKGKTTEKNTTPTTTTNQTETIIKDKDKVEKDKEKKKKKRKKVSKDYDDNDEITLQLSDTEKMDLLEDLDRKNYDYVSSDSSNTSNDSSPQKIKHKSKDTQKEIEVVENVENKDKDIESENVKEKGGDIEKVTVSKDKDEESVVKDSETEISITEVNQEECVTEELVKDSSIAEKDENVSEMKEKEIEIPVEVNTEDTKDIMGKGKDVETEKSEGEISDRESSEVEVFCISDEDGSKSKKKKKKKDKKVKKERKCTKSDFREGDDENFFKDNEKDLSLSVTIDNKDVELNKDKNIDSIDKESDSDVQEIYETFELSDDSSVCEEILSMDPTTTEIEALSAKIDEIGSEKDKQEEYKDIENISWKDRYLDSNKVKKVLNTANILNALRKKNIELKNKLAQNKKDMERKKDEEKIEPQIIEGTIDHYNTLEGSTKYVDPILPGDLKKDAKLLLKMYKKLLKYNDMNKDTKKVKKKKKKKRKDSLKDKEKKDIVNSDT